MRGMVKIAVLVNHSLIDKIIKEFKSEYPDVQFRITHNTNVTYTEIDLVISDEQKYFYYCSKFPLLKEDFLLAGRKDNPLMLGEGLDIELLRKQSFISSEKGTSMRDNTNQICNDLGIPAEYSMVTDDPYELIDYVEKGYGVAIVPSFDIGSRFSENVILKPLGNYTRTTCVFYEPGRERKRAVELFLNRLLEYNK